MLSLALQDENKLDDTYSIGILISKARAALIRYDMHDVFKIAKVKSDGKNLEAGSKDLFTEYSIITEEEVAKSNRWYYTWPKASSFRQNLKLTQEFMANHTTERLWEKCLETYESYPPEEQGGPLIFIIMIKKLVSDTESAVTLLQGTIEKIKITDYEGENVGRAVSHILAAYKRLKAVNKVPEDISKKLITVFQTSSVPEFNELFSHLLRNAEIEEIMHGSVNWPSVQSLLKLAEKTYLDFNTTDKWVSVEKKARQSAFLITSESKLELS